jgi:hypothetical protein
MKTKFLTLQRSQTSSIPLKPLEKAHSAPSAARLIWNELEAGGFNRLRSQLPKNLHQKSGPQGSCWEKNGRNSGEPPALQAAEKNRRTAATACTWHPHFS